VCNGVIRDQGHTLPPSDQLLRQAAWARRLARTLLSDDALADDIAQDVWVATGQRSPEPSEEDPHGHLAGHKVLVEAVRALAEPYRRMILLRYFEGLSFTEIGSRDKFPLETVGGKLKVAIEILREVLDRRCGGRALWVGPMTEFAQVAAPSAHRPGGVASHQVLVATGVPLARALAPGRGLRLVVVIAAATVLAAGVAWVARTQARRARVSLTEQAGATVAIVAAHDPPRAAAVAADQSVRNASEEKPRTNSDLAAAAGEDDGPCKIATIGRGPVGEACRTGGRTGAKKLMKSLVSESKRRGAKFACDSCHQDLESYALVTGAQENFVKMLVLVGNQHQ
jgi:DNA-directed RNA polymerase specialized sigma24 family protein